MGAPGGVLKQCARGRCQDRTSGGSPPMPKATFPFVTARRTTVASWLKALFFKYSDCISGPLTPV